MNKTEIKVLSFFLGAIGYPLIEILGRGYTHWSMMLTGGAAFLSFVIINEILENKTVFTRAFFGMIAVTALELSVGIIVNKLYNMNVWNYEGLRYHLFGQISLEFSACWYAISYVSFCVFDIADYIINRLKYEKHKRRDRTLLQK